MCRLTAGASNPAPVPPSKRRTLQRENEQWTVREADARRVPGARAAFCLICESSEVVRRLWTYPEDWQDLSDDDLWQLLEHGGR
jgi:hypothetical protein